jgi:16S rRNA (cytidine1402-2'-O)-methyltransferase
VSNGSEESAGTLYVIATPIGNLDDMTDRARAVLAEVDLVAVEDTRRARKLTQLIGSGKPMIVVHDHNEDRQAVRLLEQLRAGSSIGLMSDAGTPLISDPGLRIVAAARRHGFRVVPIPGPSALTAALSVSGLPTDRFIFEGFLPRRQAQRRARLEALKTERRTIVCFEAVHRVDALLADAALIFGGERPAVIARELTKVHEQIVDGTLAELGAALGDSIPLAGEFVVLIAGKADTGGARDAEVQRVYDLLVAEIPPAAAVTLCARITGRSRNEVYALVRALSD